MNFTKFRAAIAVSTLVLAGAATAAPITLSFSDVAATPTTLNYKYDGVDGNFLAAQITFDLLSISSTQASFGITIKNTSNTAGVRLGGFGIDNIAPDVISDINNPANGGADWNAESGTMPSGFKKVEFCATVGNSCSGGGGDGIGIGISDYFVWTLDDAEDAPDFGDPATIEFFSPIPVRFQALPENTFYDADGKMITSVAFDTCSPQCDPPPPPPQCGPDTIPCVVPEPGSLALVSLALLGLGAGLVRRRRSA